jgi:hypothetical protein
LCPATRHFGTPIFCLERRHGSAGFIPSELQQPWRSRVLPTKKAEEKHILFIINILGYIQGKDTGKPLITSHAGVGFRQSLSISASS